MSKLNAPRKVPYVFRVVAHSYVVWLYDDSTRAYICDAVPKIWMEPLYALLPEADAECPSCQSGTIEHSEDGETATCRGECGIVFDLDLHDIESDYYGEEVLRDNESFSVPLDEKYVTKDVPEKDAWDSAREGANGNCLI